MKLLAGIIIVLIAGACSSKNDDISSPKAKKKEVDLQNIHHVQMGIDDTIQLKSIENQDQVENGEIILSYPDGKLKAKGLLKDGKKEGLWESYHSNGNKWSSTFYVKGKANGHSITYYKNGKIHYKGEYEDGQRTGKWEFYDEQGELQREEEF